MKCMITPWWSKYIKHRLCDIIERIISDELLLSRDSCENWTKLLGPIFLLYYMWLLLMLEALPWRPGGETLRAAFQPATRDTAVVCSSPAFVRMMRIVNAFVSHVAVAAATRQAGTALSSARAARASSFVPGFSVRRQRGVPEAVTRAAVSSGVQTSENVTEGESPRLYSGEILCNRALNMSKIRAVGVCWMCFCVAPYVRF